MGGQLYNIINGEGHIWFLPMLFWCFVALFLIEKLHLEEKYVLALAVLASIFSLLTLPLRISSAAYYFIFFYTGYCIMRNGVDISTFLNKKNIIVFGILYLLIFVLSKVMLNTEWILGLTQESIPYKLLYHLIGRVCRIIYAALGVAFIYLLINYLLNNKIIIVTPGMIKLSGYCFGVYIFQQFILMPFVHNSEIIALFGTFGLPWVAFIFALIVSIVLTWVTRQTKVGRALIG